MNRSCKFFIVAITLCAAGCSSAPPIQPAATGKSPFDSAVYSGESTQIAQATPGEEAFRAFYQGGSGFVSISSVRETVEDIAIKQCARQERNVRLLVERTSIPPHILGNFPRVEWVFECAGRPSAKAVRPTSIDKLDQIERLKKLLDSGALTQQEFEHEKAKILGGL